MSTEKSLLTYETINLPTLTYNDVHDGLLLPIGVTPGGHLETLRLRTDLGTEHVCLFGRVGTGKSTAVNFMLHALLDMYSDNLTVSYVDGKDCEVRYWQKRNILNKYLLRGCPDTQSLTDTLRRLVSHVDQKKTDNPEVIVLDDIGYLLREMQGEDRKYVRELFATCSYQNVHILYTDQSAAGCVPYRDFGDMPGVFGVRCATRVPADCSQLLFGCNIATAEGSTKKYGEVVYKYRGNTSKVRIPFVGKHTR